VFLGVNLGGQMIEQGEFALELVLTGAAATFVAYLFFWPIVYALARRVFKLRRDASAVLASGISICGVSAAIATAGAIRAKPVIPVTVSMLVVIFAMIELIVLPGAYTALFPDQPVVNGAALGMTVKTDGADAAAGALLDELMIARHLQLSGEQWAPGWILSVAVSPSEIWFRFPKFVIGYFLACVSFLALAALLPEQHDALDAGTAAVQSPMRTMLFMLTFVAMGTMTDFSKLKGMGKLALLYAIALAAVIAPIAYGVAYLFHRGLTPPLAGP
jgi:uncharacterized membrane protein YadS